MAGGKAVPYARHPTRHIGSAVRATVAAEASQGAPKGHIIIRWENVQTTNKTSRRLTLRFRG